MREVPADLADRFRQGSPGSFEALVDAYQPRLTRLAYRLLGWRAPEVEDVVQDVFVAALIHRSRFRGDASLATWLTAIAVNRCRSSHRRRKLRLLLRLLDRRADGTGQDAPAWHRPVADEAARRVRHAVQSLPPRDREAIVLRYFEQLGAAEIAAATRQSTNAVEVRLHRARARLAALLSEGGKDPT